MAYPNQRPRHISPTTVIIAIALIVFSTCSLTNSFYRFIVVKLSSNDWDVLIFTQNWPVSVCLSWEYKNKGNVCLPLKSSTNWTIHGIWPTKLGTIGPSFCNISRPFNPNGVYGIEYELEERWSPIEKHKNKYMFWRHEWEKHGTCASVLPTMKTEFDYFQQGITWHEKYNMSNILSKAGILPGNKYNVSVIYENVKKVLGKSPHIACAVEPVTKSSFLLEVRICFDKNLNLTDCDGTRIAAIPRRELRNVSFTDCSLHKLVEYPLPLPYPPQPLVEYRQHYLFDVLKLLELLSWATS